MDYLLHFWEQKLEAKAKQIYVENKVNVQALAITAGNHKV